MSYPLIALLMFSSMMLLLLTGQRVFAAIGFVAAAFALALWGEGAFEMPFNASIQLLNWYPLLTLPLFIYMGYMLSESGIADDLYRMFHVWAGPVRGGLAIGTIGLMVIIAAMNGLSVAGMAIGASIALPELLRRGYDKVMVTGVIQAGSSLGILIPPSVVLILYGMIARQPIGQLWLAGVFPGLLLAGLFVAYIAIRCWIQPALGPPLPLAERQVGWAEKIRLLGAGILPLLIFFLMTGLFLMGATSLVESAAVGAAAASVVAILRRRLTLQVLEDTVRKTLSISCMFMWIILAALCFGAVFDGLGAVNAIRFLFLDEWGLSPWEVIILMQLSYLVMGTFLDDTAMLVIVAPLYIPLVISLGFDPVWYGVLYTISCQIAYMTPPFGYNLFLM
ncbi:MAG: TRAP transporter large permease, partial [Geminicoccales bacterium]